MITIILDFKWSGWSCTYFVQKTFHITNHAQLYSSCFSLMQLLVNFFGEAGEIEPGLRPIDEVHFLIDHFIRRHYFSPHLSLDGLWICDWDVEYRTMVVRIAIWNFEVNGYSRGFSIIIINIFIFWICSINVAIEEFVMNDDKEKIEP